MEIESAVEPLSVIKDFDVFEDGRPGLSQVGEGFSMDQFGFQSAPEGFHVGVVVAMAVGAHAGDHLPGMQ